MLLWQCVGSMMFFGGRVKSTNTVSARGCLTKLAVLDITCTRPSAAETCKFVCSLTKNKTKKQCTEQQGGGTKAWH